MSILKNLFKKKNTENKTPESNNNIPMFGGHYDEWRKKRIDSIVNYYGKDFFKDKTILEVGCGYGDIGAYFSSIGAKVTCSDGRSEYLVELKNRHPEIETIKADLDNEWPFTKKYDIIINLGVLYHLSKPDLFIKRSCEYSDYMILETVVADSTDENYILFLQENGYDQALNGTGCRPSTKYVERLIKQNNKSFERVMDDRCNAEFHVYDWIEENKGGSNNGVFDNGLRRFWFIK